MSTKNMQLNNVGIVSKSIRQQVAAVQHTLRKRKLVTTEEYTAEEKAWDDLLLNSNAHFMQSSSWGESKSKSQWPVSRYIAYTQDGVLPIQVFSRTVPGLGRVHYAPEVCGVNKTNIGALTEQLKKQYGKGLVFKLELYQPYSEDLIQAFKALGWVGANSVQHRNSVIVDLDQASEEDLFMSLKKRCRYEIRLAKKNGVRVEKVDITDDKLNLLSSLMNATAKRSGAFFRKNSYTNKYWHAFAGSGQGSLYFVWHDMDLLAGAYVIEYGKNAWYKDGGSVRHKSNLMGPRLLQWEIMADLRKRGIKHYDLSGVPAEEDIENSSMKGLYTFKTGFANTTTKFMPAMELPFGHRYPAWPKFEHQFLRIYSGFTKDFWY